MSADLDLTYEPSNSEANTVVDLSGEYCFGQNWGCEKCDDRRQQRIRSSDHHAGRELVELFGDISDSTFDGPKLRAASDGKSWGAVNDFTCSPEAADSWEQPTARVPEAIAACHSLQLASGQRAALEACL